MTGRERLLRVLQGRDVDRIPVAPFIFDNFIREFYPGRDIDPVEDGIRVYEHFGFDIILRTCNVWDYFNESFCSADKWKVCETRTDEGPGDWTLSTSVTTPEKKLFQKKKYSRVTPNETVEAVVEYFIKDEDDFEQFEKYQPPVPRYDCSIVGRARRLLGDRGLIAPWAQGAFNITSFYRRVDDLIVDAYENPGFYGRMMTYFGDRMYRFIFDIG